MAGAALASWAAGQDDAGSVGGAKLFTRSAHYQNQGEWDAAHRILGARSCGNTKMTHWPVRPRTTWAFACCRKRTSRAPAVEFEKVLRKDAEDEMAEEALLNLALCHYSLGFEADQDQLIKAAKLFKLHTEKFPRGPQRDQALFYYAECLAMTEHPGAAIKVYRELIDNYLDSELRPDALYALGTAHTQLRQQDEADAAFDKLAVDYPDLEPSAWRRRIGGRCVDQRRSVVCRR